MGWRRVALYLLISYGFSWTVASFLYFSHERALMTIIAPIYMFGPLVATAVLMWRYGDFSWRDIGVSLRFNRWWVVGWLFPAVFVILTTLVSLVIPGVDFSPDMMGFLERLSRYASPEELESARFQLRLMGGSMAVALFIIAMLVGATFNALFAFGEEAGWRGFLYMEMRQWGFWKMSGMVGILWGLWHAPLILRGLNYPEHPLPGIVMMTLFTTLLSPILFFLREKSGTVLVPAISHGTLNALGAFALVYIRGGNDLTTGVTGLPGLLVLLLINVALWIYRGRSD